MTLRYEGARFSDGSIAVRRIADDPCERASLTFENMRELEEEVGASDVTWIADRIFEEPRPRAPRVALVACKRDPALPPPLVIETAEDWRKHLGSDPPEWFMAPQAPMFVDIRKAGQAEEEAAERNTSSRIAHRITTVVGDPPRPAPRCECKGTGTVVDGAGFHLCDCMHGPAAPPRRAPRSAIRAVDEMIEFSSMTTRPAYAGDGHPSVRAARYERTEEIDET